MAAKDTSPIVFLDVDGVLNCRSTKPGTLGVRECSLRALTQSATIAGLTMKASLAPKRQSLAAISSNRA